MLYYFKVKSLLELPSLKCTYDTWIDGAYGILSRDIDDRFNEPFAALNCCREGDDFWVKNNKWVKA